MQNNCDFFLKPQFFVAIGIIFSQIDCRLFLGELFFAVKVEKDNRIVNV